jgi:ribosomal protein L40E
LHNKAKTKARDNRQRTKRNWQKIKLPERELLKLKSRRRILTISDQIDNYLGKPCQSNEAKKLRFELSRYGTAIIVPILCGIEPKIKQLPDLAYFPALYFGQNRTAVETASENNVLSIFENAMELVRAVGSDAETTLIVALGDTSTCVRSQAALFVGMAAVRSSISVPPLKKIVLNTREHISVKLAAAASLMNSEYTDQATWDEVMHFLKSWADKTIPSWEVAAKNHGKEAQEFFSMMVQATIPHLLIPEIIEKADENAFCLNCGAALPGGAKFCMKCGKQQPIKNK